MLMLENFVNSQNRWNAIFGKTEMNFPLTQESVNELARDIDSQLSPENLCMDGEAPVSHIINKRKYLTQVAEELEQYAQQKGYDIPAFAEL